MSCYPRFKAAAAVCTATLVLSLAGCGGGGGSNASATPPAGGGNANPAPPTGGGGAASAWTPGVFQPSARFHAQCAVPRTGIDASTGMAYADVQGSVLAENEWLRSWSNELYLWYSEIPDLDPGNYSTSNYFELLKTAAITPSGNPKDRFHFTIPTAEWVALAQSGVAAGYGAEWLVISSLPPRQILVAYTQPGSPATAPGAGLARGARVLEVDGVDAINASTPTDVDTILAGLFPQSAGETHLLTIQDAGSSSSRTIALQSANVTIAPVQHVRTLPTSTGPVGYLLFTDHIATAEQALVEAIEALSAADITDLVLDLRYNGGGFLDIASELAYMIAGPARTGGQPFESLRFNDKHPATNPVTGVPLQPVPFHALARGFSVQPGQALPTLDLPRVFLLTGSTTCSASESIVNGLRGVGVEVIQIGTATCGKPYGFYPADNCGTTYFTIQFNGVNALDFGDYGDGFAPSNTPGMLTAPVPGCSVADDLAHALGDPLERRLAAALAYRDSQVCPAPSGGSKPQISKPMAESFAIDGVVRKSPWLTQRTVSAP